MATYLNNFPKIRLSRNLFALVDQEDFDWLSKFSWCADSKGYAVRHELRTEYQDKNRKMQKMHREIMLKHGLIIESKFVDHINGNKLDNRKINLREATNSQNQANSKISSNNKTGYRGVILKNQDNNFNITKPWAAQIYVSGKRIFKGMFKTAEEAAIEYNKMAIKYFGSYARLNPLGSEE